MACQTTARAMQRLVASSGRIALKALRPAAAAALARSRVPRRSFTQAAAQTRSAATQTQPNKQQTQTAPAAAAAPVKVNMAHIKHLRDSCQAPIVECKLALQHAVAENDHLASIAANPAHQGEETESLYTHAIEWLRIKGVQTASKKSSKSTAQGLIGVCLSTDASGRQTGALVEVNSETDFVARNEAFHSLLQQIVVRVTQHAQQQQQNSKPSADPHLDVNQLLALPLQSSASSVQDLLTQHISKLRENIQFRRGAALQLASPSDVIGHYVHARVVDEAPIEQQPHHKQIVELGRIGALVSLSAVDVAGRARTPETQSALDTIAHSVAMQVVAASAQFTHRKDVPEERIAHERHLIQQQMEAAAQESGKPMKHADRALDGKLNKWLDEICLADQKQMLTEEGEKPLKISAWLTQQAKRVGMQSLAVDRFVKFETGQGIAQAPKQSFAEEVASKLGQS